MPSAHPQTRPVRYRAANPRVPILAEFSYKINQKRQQKASVNARDGGQAAAVMASMVMPRRRVRQLVVVR
jgi:hypothetical protein